MDTDTVVNSDRMKRLTDSADLTASLMIEFLSLVDRLPQALYEGLSKARRARNHWLHELQQPTPRDASRAISVASALLSTVYGIDLHIHLGLTW